MASPDPLAPDLLAGLEALTLAEVRARRGACQALETQLSYVRRLAQGRLDIVSHELAARRDGRETGDVLDELRDALSEHITSTGNGHLMTVLSPGDIDPDLLGGLDAAAPSGRLSDAGTMGDADLVAAADGLAAYEREMSTRRRAMFDRIDALQEEIVRRYRTGEATVDTLLRG